jgi:two-component system LytT family sensor kinase
MNLFQTRGGHTPLRVHLTRGLMLFGLWTLVGFLFAAIAYFPSIGVGRPFPFPWWAHLVWTLVQYYIWWGLSQFVVLLVRRFPFERQHWLRSLLIYLPASVLFPAAWAITFTSIYWALDGPFFGERPPSFLYFVWVTAFSRFPSQVLFFWMILFVLHAVAYYRKFQEREFRLVQAQLQALRAQLHPHFLFNTLNAISELVYRDPKAADRAIIKLSSLLRVTLSQGGTEEIALKDELEFLEEYIDIHKILLQDRLTVEMSIDPEALDAAVPNLILQPLAENAIRHGLDASSKRGRIEVAARREGARLHLSVRDNGPGLGNGRPEAHKEGIGLTNTRVRLKHLYGKAHDFELNDQPGQGLTVSLTIPFREIGARANYESSHLDSR